MSTPRFWVFRQLLLHKFLIPALPGKVVTEETGAKGGGEIKAFFSGLQHSCHPIAQTPTNWKARRFCQNDCNLGAIDDCVRPNDFAGGTPLPKNSFDDGLHDSGFINP